MFDPTSRYAVLAIKTLRASGSDGQPRDIRYVGRRLVPPVAEGITMVEHAVARGDRFDTIAAKYLGDPTQFWRVCDTNEVLDPNELTEQVDQRVRIAMPGI